MKLMIVHDNSGNIISLAACPDDEFKAHKVTKPGQLISVLEMPEITTTLEVKEIFKRLAGISENFRVEVNDAAMLKTK